MSYPISPWAWSAERVSPDGRYIAVITEAMEFAMGSPTTGTLVIAEKQPGGRVLASVEGTNPSFVWSGDSRALALTQVSRSRPQRLCVVSIPSGIVRCITTEFRLLE